MFKLRHIGIVCKGEIEILKNFYSKLFKPHTINEQTEEGSNIDQIVGIKNVKLKTCKLLSENITIEIIKYLKPKAYINEFVNPSFTGLNHISFTVESFEEAKKLIIESGGFCDNKKISKIQNNNVKFVKYLRDPENNILEIVEI
tara:strand:- start:17031 stop:17462 length:432 start_codon:yes stop_codon:yes gene_type:complete